MMGPSALLLWLLSRQRGRQGMSIILLFSGGFLAMIYTTAILATLAAR